MVMGVDQILLLLWQCCGRRTLIKICKYKVSTMVLASWRLGASNHLSTMPSQPHSSDNSVIDDETRHGTAKNVFRAATDGMGAPPSP